MKSSFSGAELRAAPAEMSGLHVFVLEVVE